MLEYVGAVVVQVRALFTRELANSDTGIDAPRIEQLVSDLGNDQQLLVAREGDVALVEQMVDCAGTTAGRSRRLSARHRSPLAMV